MDINFYETAPWDYDDVAYPSEMTQKPEVDEYQKLIADLEDDDVDHFEIPGIINLLKFEHFKRVLDPHNGGDFRGFTPRWTAPAKIRNPDDHSRTAAVLVVVHDSQREVDLDMQPYFS